MKVLAGLALGIILGLAAIAAFHAWSQDKKEAPIRVEKKLEMRPVRHYEWITEKGEDKFLYVCKETGRIEGTTWKLDDSKIGVSAYFNGEKIGTFMTWGQARDAVETKLKQREEER